MLSFKELQEKKKSKIKLNPTKEEMMEKKSDHCKSGESGEDCDCMKCEKKRRKGDVNDGPDMATEGYDKPDEKLKTGRNMYTIPKDEQSAAAERLKAKAAAKRKELKKEETETKLLTFGQFDELYKGKHGQSEKEYQDSRSQGGKMVSGDSKGSGAKYTHGRRVDDGGAGPQPAGGSKKPKAQGKMDRGGRAELQMRKANLKAKNEEVEEVEEAEKRIKAKGSDKSKKIVPDAGPAYYKKPKDHVKYEEVVSEEGADSLKDRRMERGGVDGNNRYKKAPGKPNTFGKKPGQKYDGMSALEKVKANIQKQYGKGAIIDTKKKK